MSPSPAQPLSRERIVDAALQVADEEGAAASLTVRKIAARLEVKAMALYYYFPNKDAILDAMVDAIFAEIELPSCLLSWQEAMRQRAHSARQVLSRHPWALGLMDSRRNPGPATLFHHDAMIGALTNAGFSIPLTAHAIALLDAHLYGFALQELNLPIDPSTSIQQVAADIMASMQDNFPHLASFARAHVLQPGYDFGDEFEWGLELLLDALEARRAREASAR